MYSPLSLHGTLYGDLYLLPHRIISTGGAEISKSVQRPSYRLDNLKIVVRFLAGAREFSVFLSVQKLWAHTTSYSIDPGGSFPRGKAAGSWTWLCLHLVFRLRISESIPPFPKIAARSRLSLHLLSRKGSGRPDHRTWYLLRDLRFSQQWIIVSRHGVTFLKTFNLYYSLCQVYWSTGCLKTNLVRPVICKQEKKLL